MKKLPIILLSMLILGCAEKEENGQQVTIEEEKEKDDLSAIALMHVSSKSVSAYEYKFGEPSGDGVKIYQTSYDERGNLIDSTVYNNNSIAYQEKLEYNKANKLVKRVLFDSTGNSIQRSEVKLDEKGNELEFLLFAGDSMYYKQSKEYNDKDEMVKLTEYDSQGKPKLISEFKYTPNGEVASQTEMTGGGEKLGKIAYGYNENGDRNAITNYGSSGYSEGKTLLKDFDNGNARVIEKYDANDSMYASYQYEYNENGQETKSIIFNGVGQIIRQSNAEFDKNGNKIKFEIYEGEVGFLGKDVLSYNDNNQETELIVFDDKNNQVKRQTKSYNEKGLIADETTYNKIDEPIFQFVYTYTYFK